MISKIAGQLNPVEYDGAYFESEPFPIPYFDNKKLKVGFVEANHPPYLSGADNVLESFLKLTRSDRIRDSETVYKYYDETLKYAHTNSLKIKSIEDVWDFVYPSELIILWDQNEDFYLCASCGCEWEEEHGLQLIFKNGQVLTRASGHDFGFTD